LKKAAVKRLFLLYRALWVLFCGTILPFFIKVIPLKKRFFRLMQHEMQHKNKEKKETFTCLFFPFTKVI